jgi:hypothetical protein
MPQPSHFRTPRQNEIARLQALIDVKMPDTFSAADKAEFLKEKAIARSQQAELIREELEERPAAEVAELISGGYGLERSGKKPMHPPVIDTRVQTLDLASLFDNGQVLASIVGLGLIGLGMARGMQSGSMPAMVPALGSSSRRQGGRAIRTIVASRRISDVARDIYAAWPKVNYAAAPYLKAMRDLETMSDMDMHDSAKDIVIRFLANASSFRGPKAKELKAELKTMIGRG